MSTSPYSIDLREKVIKYIEGGHSHRNSAVVFNIHYQTIGNWWRRYKKEGSFKALPRPGSKPNMDSRRRV